MKAFNLMQIYYYSSKIHDKLHVIGSIQITVKLTILLCTTVRKTENYYYYYYYCQGCLFGFNHEIKEDYYEVKNRWNKLSTFMC